MCEINLIINNKLALNLYHLILLTALVQHENAFYYTLVGQHSVCWTAHIPNVIKDHNTSQYIVKHSETF